MKQPGSPPRSSDFPNDPRVASALEIAKSYEPAEARMLSALDRFEAARAAGADPGAALQSGDGRWMFSVKAVGALAAIVLGVGVGWTVHRSEPAHSASPVASVAAPSEAPTATPTVLNGDEPAQRESPVREEPRTMRVDELPTAMPTLADRPPVRTTLSDKPPGRVASTASAAANAPTADTPNAARISFDDELALVEAARTSLARGAIAACLAHLDDYDRRVHGGDFEREVAVIRIEALIANGQTDRARTLGQAFLAKSPESPYANRIRSLLTRLPAPTKAP